MFVIGGAWIIFRQEVDNLTGYMAVAFFGYTAIFSLWIMFSNQYLHIMDGGFSLRHLGRVYDYSWEDCKEFRVWRVVFVKFVVFNSTNPNRRGLALFDRYLSKCNDGLPDTYGLPAKNLAMLLNKYRTQAINQASNSTSV